MKQVRRELDVDFIGGGEPLTKDEEKAISDFIKANKAKNDQVLQKKSWSKVKRVMRDKHIPA